MYTIQTLPMTCMILAPSPNSERFWLSSVKMHQTVLRTYSPKVECLLVKAFVVDVSNKFNFWLNWLNLSQTVDNTSDGWGWSPGVTRVPSCILSNSKTKYK